MGDLRPDALGTMLTKYRFRDVVLYQPLHFEHNKLQSKHKVTFLVHLHPGTSPTEISLMKWALGCG